MTETNDAASKEMTHAEIEEQAELNYDTINELQERLEQVSAMLTLTYGNDSFDKWRGDIKDNYLWACSTMLDQAKALASKIDLRIKR